MRNLMQNALFLIACLYAAGCGSKGATFSLLQDSASFVQNASPTNGQVDILWVVDNSGSMATSQTNLTDNFSRFIELFSQKNLDYKMAVTTSDSYRAVFVGPTTLAKFRDGSGSNHSGQFVITPLTTNLLDTFVINLTQGTSGSGDERAFHSMQVALDSSLNSGFRRPGAFFSTVIVSDEDDFSATTSAGVGVNYNHANIVPVSSYVTYLDTLTGATAANRKDKYSVNAITILDNTCLTQLNASFSGRRLGLRHAELADSTNGMKISLCGDFATELSLLSKKIVELTTQFFLSRVPIVSTVVVIVNGGQVIQDDNNGWSYNAESNSIVFHGDAIPAAGSMIQVNFDPQDVK